MIESKNYKIHRFYFSAKSCLDPLLLSPEEQSNSSSDVSSNDGSSLALLEGNTTNETSATTNSTSIHSNDVPEEQDIEDDESDDSSVIMIDNLEVVSGDAYKWGKGACHMCEYTGHYAPGQRPSTRELMLADVKQLEFAATMELLKDKEIWIADTHQK